MNDQRKVIFDQRIELMKDENVADTVADMRHSVIDDLVAKHVPEKAYPEQWDTPGLKTSSTACLAWTFRSTSGPRKKASPTRS
jgi:preprotein translocase subunit SecA